MTRLIDDFLADPSTFLGDETSYERAAALVRKGGVSILYAPLFGEELPDLVNAAMSVQDDPIRVIYLKNAPEQALMRRQPVSTETLRRMFEGEHVDPNGKILMITEMAANRPAGHSGGPGGDAARFARPIGSAATALMEGQGGLNAFFHSSITDGLFVTPR